MIYPHFQCIVTGREFIPTGLLLSEQITVEKTVDAVPTERHGKAIYSATPANSLERLVILIEKYAEIFRECGAEEIEVYAAIRYEGQANWEISPDMLSRLGRLNAHLLVSFYERLD